MTEIYQLVHLLLKDVVDTKVSFTNQEGASGLQVFNPANAKQIRVDRKTIKEAQELVIFTYMTTRENILSS